MRRILIGAVGLLGVLVLSIVALLETADRPVSLDIAVVVVEEANNGARLYAYQPENRHWDLLMPSLYQPQIFGLAADGLWVYVHGRERLPQSNSWGTGGVFRVRLDGAVVERLAEVDSASGVVFSKTWLAYLGWDEVRLQEALIKLPLDGQPPKIITAWTFGGFPQGMVVAPDGQHIAFSAVPPDDTDLHVFVVPTAGGVPQDLTKNFDGPYRLVFWTSPDEWLVMYTGEAYVALRPDGSDLRRILPGGSNPTVQGEMEWVAAAQMAVIRGTYDYWVHGIRIGADTPAWAIEGVVAITPDGQSVIYQSTNGTSSLWKMPIAGGTAQEIIALSPMDVGVAISPDSRYALVATFVENFDRRNLLRVDLQDGTVKTLYTQTLNAVPNFAWSSDSQWVSFYDGLMSGGALTERLVFMRADGSQRHSLNFAAGRAYPTWLQGPPLDFESRWVIIFIGAGLLGLSFGVAVVRSRKNS